jgi:hypothetical protein
MKWRPLLVPDVNDGKYKDAVRLNSLGSLFFFAQFTLKKTRLRLLHRQMCASLETEDLHLVLEEPMRHFKTTMGIALSMWWAMPFTERDEVQMREYLALQGNKNSEIESWIRWMKKAHNQNTRTLVTHEIEGRAIAMGKEIDEHYQNNDLFRFVFQDVIPRNTDTWNDHHKFQRRVKGSGNIDATNGTYEYRGVGGALQGVSADSVINDDSVGKEAQRNMLQGGGEIMEDIYRWWQQTTTRFDSQSYTGSGLGRQLVIGNRWGHDDLNSKIKKKHREFKFETHSAEGGCCKLHPAGVPIFPEEFTVEKLAHIRYTLQTETGSNYDYAHFFLNQSVLPEECIFHPDWKRHYRFKQSRPDLALDDVRNHLHIEHETYNGKAVADLPAGVLHRRMIVDLAHAKKRKRCNHVVLVVGWNPESDWLYILEVYAKNQGYSILTDKIYEIGHRWAMSDMWLETVAAQDLMKFHIEERNKKEKKPIYVNELPYDNSENAKKNRIELLEPLYKNAQVWSCRTGQEAYEAEYDNYPASPTIDILDTLGYVPQTLVGIRSTDTLSWVLSQHDSFAQREVGAGGY